MQIVTVKIKSQKSVINRCNKQEKQKAQSVKKKKILSQTLKIVNSKNKTNSWTKEWTKRKIEQQAYFEQQTNRTKRISNDTTYLSKIKFFKQNTYILNIFSFIKIKVQRHKRQWRTIQSTIWQDPAHHQ